MSQNSIAFRGSHRNNIERCIYLQVFVHIQNPWDTTPKQKLPGHGLAYSPPSSNRLGNCDLVDFWTRLPQSLLLPRRRQRQNHPFLLDNLYALGEWRFRRGKNLKRCFGFCTFWPMGKDEILTGNLDFILTRVHIGFSGPPSVTLPWICKRSPISIKIGILQSVRVVDPIGP